MRAQTRHASTGGVRSKRDYGSSRGQGFTRPTGPVHDLELYPEGNGKPRKQLYQMCVLKVCFGYSKAMDPDRLGARKPVMRLLQWSREETLQHRLTRRDQNWREGDIRKRYLGGKNGSAWIQHSDGGRGLKP